MAEFITVAATGDVEEGAAKAFEVKGAEVAVARSGSALYAFSDICTHRHCNLSMAIFEPIHCVNFSCTSPNCLPSCTHSESRQPVGGYL